jgi:5-methylcytosine-specific restriction endonuclease McrA
MAREFAKPFYNSAAWKKVRKAFISNRISIDGGVCQHCKKELGYIVDHIKELNPENINDTSITLSWSNLQYLCLECHNTKTFGSKEDKQYYFDSNGMVQPIE